MNKKYHLLTLGCQMNVSDSERIASKLNEIGYKSAPEKEADLVIVNSCSVRQHAVDRIWGFIKKWQNAGKRVAITGCVLDQDKKKFDKKDIITFNIKELENLKDILTQTSQTVQNGNKALEYFDIKPAYSGKVAYIPIMTGCDNFCSYCAVPYTRGREVSRPMSDVIKEVKEALDKGFNKIMLLGQNVNSYKYGFDKLLLKIDKMSGDFKFNFISSNPHDMTNDIIDAFSKLKKWPRELHLAMQSGDDDILRKMNRKYDSKEFLSLVATLKSLVPDIVLTTDIIVGFPTETKTQFNNTVKICKKIGFKNAFISQYSTRVGTLAAKMEDNVSKEEKKRRWLVLDKLINR